jgi:chemotaxis protein CheC
MTISLTSEQLQALQGLFNTGVNRANTMLNYLTELPLQAQMSPLEILSLEQVRSRLLEHLATVPIGVMELSYSGDFDGVARLLYPEDTSLQLVDAIGNEERRKLDRQTFRKQTLSEVGNILFNGLMGSLSNITDRSITYMAPSYKEGQIEQLFPANEASNDRVALCGQADWEISQLQASGAILICFEVTPIDRFLTAVDRMLENQ